MGFAINPLDVTLMIAAGEVTGLDAELEIWSQDGAARGVPKESSQKRPLMVSWSFMWRCVIVLGVALCLDIPAHAQQQAPKLLVDATHCLSIKGFLPTVKTATLSSGYFVDSKSYPGDRVLYVVVYTSPQRSRGMVFSIFLTHKGTQQVFNIQNNGGFVRFSKKGAAFPREGVDFVEDGQPLGGIWTQEHIALAIKKIGLQPVVEVSVIDLLNPSTTVRCESYADRK
jgi:hypothetical protein